MSALGSLAGATVGLAIAAGVVPALAAAGGSPPPRPKDAAVAQYVEAIPTSGGDVPAGATGTRPLPAQLSKTIERLGGDEAPALEKVARSAAYGAPQRQLVRPVRHRATSRPPSPSVRAPRTASRPALSAAATTVTGSGSGSITFALGAMTAIAVAGSAIFVNRRRRA